MELLGGLHHRVAQRQIEHFVGPDLGFERHSLLEDAADPATFFHEPPDLLGHCHVCTSAGL